MSKMICDYCGKQIKNTRYVHFSLHSKNRVVDKYYHYTCYLEMLPKWEALTLDLYKKR